MENSVQLYGVQTNTPEIAQNQPRENISWFHGEKLAAYQHVFTLDRPCHETQNKYDW